MRTAYELVDLSKKIRIDILKMFYISQTGHLAPALSCTDIFVALYFAPIIEWDKRFSEERDRVILSKGHACAAQYACLARAGYFSRKQLLTFYQRDTLLAGHPNVELNGIETATGALGHGICFATGTALAAKISEKDYRTYVVVGDGECQEGAVWEAAMFAANHELDNLVAVLDKNGLQASDEVQKIAPIEDIKKKWEAFGWNTIVVNGHDYTELIDSFSIAKETKSRPTIIIANTVKGKGIKIAENNIEWHSRAPKEIEWEQVLESYKLNLEDMRKI